MTLETQIISYREAIFDWIDVHRTWTFSHLAILGAAILLYVASSPRRMDSGGSNPDVPIRAATAEVSTPAPQLDPPKDDPFTPDELKMYDGTNEDRPIYVAIKGTVFDVTNKRDMYAPGKGYHLFAGKDASRGLGKSSLKPEDAVSDYSTLDETEMKVLDDWVKYYTKRYQIVGKVVQSANKL